MKVIPVNEDKFYIAVDNIRLIVEYGSIIGWYEP